jgi:membrane protease subunit (stomatin/prohibitin family)
MLSGMQGAGQQMGGRMGNMMNGMSQGLQGGQNFGNAFSQGLGAAANYMPQQQESYPSYGNEDEEGQYGDEEYAQ